MAVGVEEYGRARVQAIQLFPDTGIEADSRGPARLKLTVRAGNDPVHVGDHLRLAFTVTNTGAYPAIQVQVRALSDGLVTSPADQSVLRFRRVDTSASGSLALRATRPGTGKVAVRLTGATNDSRTAAATMFVYPADRFSWRDIARKAVLICVFMPALILIVPWCRLRPRTRA